MNDTKSQTLAALGFAALLFSSASDAHFQMIQTNNYLRDKGGRVTLQMPFTHPSSGGPMMDMGKPESFTLTHKGKTQDLSDKLQEVQFQGVDNASRAWQADAKLRGLGDYVFALQPAPYLEKAEDVYIQQFTKTIVNVGGLPTDWDKPLNLPAEIVPDQAPYAVYAGGTFSAQVLADGKPVPNLEVEVEYLNYPMDEKALGFINQPTYHYPSETLNILTIRTDENGRFFFGIPHAGFWGFAALGAGAKDSHEGKELSQDAVLWIQAHQLKKN